MFFTLLWLAQNEDSEHWNKFENWMKPVCLIEDWTQALINLTSFWVTSRPGSPPNGFSEESKELWEKISTEMKRHWAIRIEGWVRLSTKPTTYSSRLLVLMHESQDNWSLVQNIQVTTPPVHFDTSSPELEREWFICCHNSHIRYRIKKTSRRDNSANQKEFTTPHPQLLAFIGQE